VSDDTTDLDDEIDEVDGNVADEADHEDIDDDDEVDEHNLVDDGDYDDDDDDDEDGGNTADEGNRLPAASAVAVLEYLARAVVSDPDGVEVDVEQTGRGVTLAVHVSDGDLGRVIGRRGRVANAIRTIVRAAAVNDGTEVDVDFRD
jgi:hypothetical protein